MGKAQNNCSHCPRASLPLLHILMGSVGVRVLFLVRIFACVCVGGGGGGRERKVTS